MNYNLNENIIFDRPHYSKKITRFYIKFRQQKQTENIKIEMINEEVSEII